jgi:hypothetical protein
MKRVEENPAHLLVHLSTHQEGMPDGKITYTKASTVVRETHPNPHEPAIVSK